MEAGLVFMSLIKRMAQSEMKQRVHRVSRNWVTVQGVELLTPVCFLLLIVNFVNECLLECWSHYS